MPEGYFIRKGDKTTCGGEVLEADTRVRMFGFAHAREGDRVSCGKNDEIYKIVGGISFMQSHGRLVAGSLDSVSSCPCRARLIPSTSEGSYEPRRDPGPNTARAPSEQPTRQPAQQSTTQAPASPYPSGFMEQQPAPTKIGIALRIGVFFDGTGNNADNTALGMACGAHHAIKPDDIDASCKPYMSDPDSSYGNEATNVAKLFDRYTQLDVMGNEGRSKAVQRKLYIDGIGTITGGKDSLIGSGIGRGHTGVVSRVQQSLHFISSLVEAVIKENPGGEINSLTFDTVGFSRGAAAARHFANELALGKRGLLEEVLSSNANGFGRHFLGQFNRDIHVAFIGLFDTVASIAGLDNFANIKSPVAPGLRLYLARSQFTNVVHLVACNEYRVNFPLSRIKPDHPEIELPGVHSDIGGGYLVEAHERVLMSPMQGLTVPKGTDVRTTSIYRDALQHRAVMIAEGWPPAMLAVVTPPPRLLPQNPRDRLGAQEERVYAALQLSRSVRGELSRVYLRVMHALAKQKGVRLDEIPDTPQYQIPAELQSLCDRFIAGDYRVTAEEQDMLRLHYIHTSAHWNHPLDKTGHREATLLYINAPTADGMRVQQPHVTHRGQG